MLRNFSLSVLRAQRSSSFFRTGKLSRHQVTKLCEPFIIPVGAIFYKISHAESSNPSVEVLTEVEKCSNISAALTGPNIFREKLLKALSWIKAEVYNFFVLLFRSIYLMLVYSPAVATSPLLMGSSSIRAWWWAIVRDCIRRSGPCSLKFSQWIATRPDLFPIEACKNLEDLQSKVHRHKWSQTEKALQRAFGESWQGYLQIDWVDEKKRQPVVLGSGCVAQVIRGFTKGRQVAIKLIHPGVAEEINADIIILRSLSWLAELFPGMKDSFSLSESVEEFSTLMREQLDLTVEARNLERFRRNFDLRAGVSGPNASARNPRVTFPEPVLEFTTSGVLVETYEPGRVISEVLDVIEDKKLRREIAEAGLNSILKMVFEDNFVHADLHPGNVIIQCERVSGTAGAGVIADRVVDGDYEGNTDISALLKQGNCKWHLSFIDAGLVASLAEGDRCNFIDLFAAVIKNDGRRVGELMIERSRNGGATAIDREGFSRGIGELVTEVHKSGLSLGKIGVGALLQKVLVLCYLHRVKLEPKFISVVVAIGVLEGLGRRLDPEVDVLAHAAPYVLRALLTLPRETKTHST